MSNLSKQTKPRKRKAWKITSIICTVLLMICVLSITTFLILDSAGVVSVVDGVSRQYTMTFKVDDQIYLEQTIYRGSTIDYSELHDPMKEGSLYKYYTFEGWDITGDGRKDSLPTKAYRSFTAEAIFVTHWRIGL